ncbi:MAG: DUF4290 domain-containing protein [Bacteroidales bacterium]|nr:DUF4290 domain-containing protein [Bacteroidales bacterium]
MLTYNTRLKRLVLPEYGRNIQRMVDHCLEIKDRDLRTRCAYSIIDTMGNLFPQLRDEPDYKHKLWDHLAIMSDFQLDIDFPCEVIQQESLHTLPEPVPYTASIGPNRFRHYGRYIVGMIDRCAQMEAGEEKDALIFLLANHMKKLMLQVNPEAAEDAKIFKDLAELSHGAIRLDPELHRLHEFEQIVPAETTGKKKKKKKK